MSSIMRWRSGLIDRMVMANASLVEVDTSIFRKAFAAYDDLTGARSCSTQAVPHTNLSRSDLVLWLVSAL
jgi:hypothetical protein